MVKTQRMSDATLKSTQVSWYPKGKVTLTCYKRGQSVTGYYGGPSNLWYLTADGYYIADIDMNTGTNNPVTAACPATAKIDTNRYYTITSRNSGKLVDVRGAGTKNGTAIQQYQANGSRAQSFKFISTGGGFYRVVSELSGSQVWDAAGGRKTNGIKVHTWNWGGPGAANQQWMPVVTGSHVTFKPRHAYPAMCLDIPGASKNSGVQLQLYSCNGSAAQQWTLKAKPVPAPPKQTRETKAVNWANSQLGSKEYYKACLRFVAISYGGPFTHNGSLNSALTMFNDQKARGAIHYTTTNIPKGALVFSRNSQDGGDGHVMLSRGDGTFVNPAVDEVKVSRHPAGDTGPGYHFLGWSYAPSNWSGR